MIEAAFEETGGRVGGPSGAAAKLGMIQKAPATPTTTVRSTT